MTLVFLDASLGIFGVAGRLCVADYSLPQLQPILARHRYTNSTLSVGGRIYVERPLETGAGIDRALNAAQRAQPAWGSLPLPIRCEILGEAVEAFVSQATDIATEITWQMGRPIRHSPHEVHGFEERARYMLSTAPPEFVALERGDEAAARRLRGFRCRFRRSDEEVPTWVTARSRNNFGTRRAYLRRGGSPLPGKGCRGTAAPVRLIVSI